MLNSIYARVAVGTCLLMCVSFGAAYGLRIELLTVNQLVLATGAILVAIGFWTHWLLAPVVKVNDAIASGILSLKDNDFSVSIHNQGYQETKSLVSAYNALTAILRSERMSINQRELLLDTVIENAPIALVLVKDKYVVHANLESRRIFKRSHKLVGESFIDLCKALPQDLHQLVMEGRQGLVTYVDGDQTFVMQVQRQLFYLHGHAHELFLIQNLSRAMSQKEHELWRTLIRLISHEINNSLAPIQSLARSAKTIAHKPEHLNMLDGIMDTIVSRSEHLQGFIQQYIEYAKLPEPQMIEVDIPAFFHQMETLLALPCTCHTDLKTGYFDRAQIEQVLINLVKNAKESGSSPEEVGFELNCHGEELVFTIFDRGRGMSDDQLAQALMPFYSTKEKGTGIGLTLSSDIVSGHNGKLRLFNRDHGGLCVSFSLPVAR